MLVSFDEGPNAVKVRYRTCTDRARSLAGFGGKREFVTIRGPASAGCSGSGLLCMCM